MRSRISLVMPPNGRVARRLLERHVRDAVLKLAVDTRHLCAGKGESQTCGKALCDSRCPCYGWCLALVCRVGV